MVVLSKRDYFNKEIFEKDGCFVGSYLQTYLQIYEKSQLIILIKIYAECMDASGIHSSDFKVKNMKVFRGFNKEVLE